MPKQGQYRVRERQWHPVWKRETDYIIQIYQRCSCDTCITGGHWKDDYLSHPFATREEAERDVRIWNCINGNQEGHAHVSVRAPVAAPPPVEG